MAEHTLSRPGRSRRTVGHRSRQLGADRGAVSETTAPRTGTPETARAVHDELVRPEVTDRW